MPRETAREAPEAEVEAAKRRVREAAEALAEAMGPAAWVRRHPWEAVGLALAAGFLLGQDPALRRRLGLLLAEGALLGLRRRGGGAP
ncbi:MAG: hypothetical protein D6809_03665 [Gammaproteobacteria bacterium]|nr:MAG: hypothetical protein D6809_03665 [Gammaproteobacteria bacterium]